MVVKCNVCNKNIKVKARFLRTCKKCGLAMCKCCNIEGYCSSCHPANQDNKLVYEYFKDKYLEKAQGVVSTMLFMFMFLLLIPGVTGLGFADETIEATITDFRWCFTPFDDDISSYSDDWRLWTENHGCEFIGTPRMYAIIPYTYERVKCSTPPDECNLEDKITVNGTSKEMVCTPQEQECVMINETVQEQYDMKSDFLLPKGSRV